MERLTLVPVDKLAAGTIYQLPLILSSQVITIVVCFIILEVD